MRFFDVPGIANSPIGANFHTDTSSVNITDVNGINESLPDSRWHNSMFNFPKKSINRDGEGAKGDFNIRARIFNNKSFVVN